MALVGCFNNTSKAMNFTIEIELERDGRWIAEVVDIPGVLAYGQTREEAVKKAKVLTFRVFADLLEHGELTPELINISFAAA